MNSRDPPSKILLLIITYLPPTYPLTNDSLYQRFKGYGDLKKILIFERGKANKAFIEFYDVKSAIAARKDMIGQSLTNLGDRLLIHFSRLKQLDLEVVDNSRGTDYTFYEESTHQNEEIQSQESKESFEVQESPSKVIMETHLKQLERILDEDYQIEAQKVNCASNEGYREIQDILQQKPSKVLLVQNIDDRVTQRMLYNLFNRFGHLESLMYSQRRKCALLQFQNIDNAIIAKEILNNCLFFNGQDKQLRIIYSTNSLNSNSEEYYQGSNTKFKIVMPNKVLLFTGCKELLELQDMVKCVGKISEVKLEGNLLTVTMLDVFEALKVISVFSEYEHKGSRINLSIKQ